MVNEDNDTDVVTNDKDKINEIINLLNDRNYTKSNQEYLTGCIYYYDFYSGDEIKARVRISGDGNHVKFNSTYYDVSKPISETVK